MAVHLYQGQGTTSASTSCRTTRVAHSRQVVHSMDFKMVMSSHYITTVSNVTKLHSVFVTFLGSPIFLSLIKHHLFLGSSTFNNQSTILDLK
jgi:hypothetical protein